eukprot:g7106.t1
MPTTAPGETAILICDKCLRRFAVKRIWQDHFRSCPVKMEPPKDYWVDGDAWVDPVATPLQLPANESEDEIIDLTCAPALIRSFTNAGEERKTRMESSGARWKEKKKLGWQRSYQNLLGNWNRCGRTDIGCPLPSEIIHDLLDNPHILPH